MDSIKICIDMDKKTLMRKSLLLKIRTDKITLFAAAPIISLLIWLLKKQFSLTLKASSLTDSILSISLIVFICFLLLLEVVLIICSILTKDFFSSFGNHVQCTVIFTPEYFSIVTTNNKANNTLTIPYNTASSLIHNNLGIAISGNFNSLKSLRSTNYYFPKYLFTKEQREQILEWHKKYKHVSY